MLLKKEIEMHFDIIIGETAVIDGDMNSEGSIRVDGTINGNLTCKGNIIISDKALVTGNICCLNAEIYGSCIGNVSVQGKVNLHEHASLDGDISAKSFVTKEGAHFLGKCYVDVDLKPIEDQNDNLITLPPAEHLEETPPTKDSKHKKA